MRSTLKLPDTCQLSALTPALALCLGLLGAVTAWAAPTADDTAASLMRTSGVSGGIVAVIEPADAELPTALAKQGSFLVHCLTADPQRCEALRRDLRAKGVYGTVSAGTCEGDRLPYAGNLINIVVVASLDGAARQLTAAELHRVLTPQGTAFLAAPAAAARPPALPSGLAELQRAESLTPLTLDSGCPWLAYRKPRPAEIDEWTHYLHGPDGNPVAEDTVVGPPVHLQWQGGPRWLRCHETDSSVSTLVTAQGRLLALVDEAPISLAGQHALPDKWFLIARDAFNGVLLWKVPIQRWGWREWKPIWFNTRPGDIPLNIQKRLVADGDRVYVTLGYQAPVSQLDARTGEILQSYAGTERTGEILYREGTLFLSVLDGRQLRVVAVEAATGQRRWASSATYRGTTVDYIKWKEMNGGSEPVELDPSLNMATDGQTVALIDGPDLVGLDAATGGEQWRIAFPSDEADLSAGGIRSQGNLWIGTLIVRDGVVIHASPSKLAAFAADTGRVLWEQPKKYIGHLWYEWKDVFVIGDLVWTWSADLTTSTSEAAAKPGANRERAIYPRSANGYDLHTGVLRQQVPLGGIFNANHHHRCYRNKATSQYILASRRGTEFVDLVDGRHTIDNWVRSTCHVGMMPANGLQYVPPHPCQCYIAEKLNGFLALAARREAESFDVATPPRLEKGPAFRSSFVFRASDFEPDWPAYRHDGQRSGATTGAVPDELTLQWRVPLGRRVTPPIAVEDRVFVALTEEHHVACLDARTGERLWEFAAGGRVDSPPTWHQGTVLFGSTDGWVYCLRADDGRLVWRFRGGPAERLVSVDGQLESAWPVPGSVLVQGDTVYFAAGRSSHLDGGLRLFGLAAATGEVRWQTRLDGPQYTVANLPANFRPPEGFLPDILVGDGDTIFLRSQAFSPDLQPQSGQPPLQVPGGFLDDSYFKRVPWTYGSPQNYGRLLVHDDRRLFVVRMFDSLRGLDPTVFFTPGDKGYLLFGKEIDSRANTWEHRVPVRIRAMLLARDRLLTAGPPDVIDPQDPLAAFEGRKGGVLHVLNAATGERLAQQPLPSPPVFNGLAAARGRLFLVSEDGTLACYSQP